MCGGLSPTFWPRARPLVLRVADEHRLLDRQQHRGLGIRQAAQAPVRPTHGEQQAAGDAVRETVHEVVHTGGAVHVHCAERERLRVQFAHVRFHQLVHARGVHHHHGAHAETRPHRTPAQPPIRPRHQLHDEDIHERVTQLQHETDQCPPDGLEVQVVARKAGDELEIAGSCAAERSTGTRYGGNRVTHEGKRNDLERDRDDDEASGDDEDLPRLADVGRPFPPLPDQPLVHPAAIGGAPEGLPVDAVAHDG
jgi:hypothetical protein